MELTSINKKTKEKRADPKKQLLNEYFINLCLRFMHKNGYFNEDLNDMATIYDKLNYFANSLKDSTGYIYSSKDYFDEKYKNSNWNTELIEN